MEPHDPVTNAEREQLWLDEAARRVAQIDAGEVELIPGEDVARKARALLK